MSDPDDFYTDGCRWNMSQRKEAIECIQFPTAQLPNKQLIQVDIVFPGNFCPLVPMPSDPAGFRSAPFSKTKFGQLTLRASSTSQVASKSYIAWTLCTSLATSSSPSAAPAEVDICKNSSHGRLITAEIRCWYYGKAITSGAGLVQGLHPPVGATQTFLEVTQRGLTMMTKTFLHIVQPHQEVQDGCHSRKFRRDLLAGDEVVTVSERALVGTSTVAGQSSIVDVCVLTCASCGRSCLAR